MTDGRQREHSEPDRFDEIYRSTCPENIPWNSEQPPELLVELIESGKVKPFDSAQGRSGRALDLGCGLGSYAIWLAGRGFDVVGIDVSPTAIKIARRNAKKKGVKCKFVAGDVTGSWSGFGTGFDFVYDWELLHHIPPENRDEYVENVHRILRAGGKYVSMCFNEKDAAFEGTGKYRKTNMGTAVYLSSKEELRELFGRLLKIIDFRVLEITGKAMTHVFNYCFMERKGK
jgi:SAM-dependent methyltransferase